MKKTSCWVSVSALAIGGATLAPVAGGAQAADDEGLEEVVVTATRMATNLQDTPIAITAVTAEALEERGITSIGDLTSVVPNAQFRRVQGAFGPGVSAFIRGIGPGDTGLAGEPAVAFYIDDVYYPRAAGFELRPARHRAHRGAARPAGHAVRPQLAGRRGQRGRQGAEMAETTGYVRGHRRRVRSPRHPRGREPADGRELRAHGVGLCRRTAWATRSSSISRARWRGAARPRCRDRSRSPGRCRPRR